MAPRWDLSKQTGTRCHPLQQIAEGLSLQDGFRVPFAPTRLCSHWLLCIHSIEKLFTPCLPMLHVHCHEISKSSVSWWHLWRQRMSPMLLGFTAVCKEHGKVFICRRCRADMSWGFLTVYCVKRQNGRSGRILMAMSPSFPEGKILPFSSMI